MVSPRCFSFAAILLIASIVSARAVDEIQVYNAEIAKVGQWTFQLHSNYAFIGRKEPGLGADSEEKHEPVSDIVVVDSLKALDPERPIREADIFGHCRDGH